MIEPGEMEPLRSSLFAYLTALMRIPGAADGLPSSLINEFTHDGRQVRLILQRGIRVIRGNSAALAIITTYRRPGAERPYDDRIGMDGLLRYKYRGTNPDESDNRSLRAAMERRLPLAYFYGVGRAVYLPIWPVWIRGEDRDNCEFAVSVDQTQNLILADGVPPNGPLKAYVERITKQRVHQPIFRAEVMRAYHSRCAICNLCHERDLLDAAHIIRDGAPRGDPVVTNGMAMCKIHHAAFDGNIIGIRPDRVVEVRRDVLEEIDGPMLRYGIQGMAGRVAQRPSSRLAWPDPDRLEERYREFLAKTG